MISFALFPYIASQPESKITPFLSRITFSVLLIISIGLALFSKVIFSVLYGTQFIESALILIILLPGILIYGTGKIISADLAGRGKIKYNMIGAVIGAVSNIILNIILIPRYNIQGAAVATSISYILSVIYIVYVFQKDKKYSDLFILKSTDIHIIKKFKSIIK